MENATKRKIWIWVVIILVVVNVTSLATIGYHRYQVRHKNTAEMRDGRAKADRYQQRKGERRTYSERYRQALNLSELQTGQMDSIQSYYEQERRKVSREMGQLRRELSQELTKVTINQTRLIELSEEQALLFNKMNENTITLNMAIRSILLPEQIPAYIEQLKKMERSREASRRPAERSRRKQ